MKRMRTHSRRRGERRYGSLGSPQRVPTSPQRKTVPPLSLDEWATIAKAVTSPALSALSKVSQEHLEIAEQRRKEKTVQVLREGPWNIPDVATATTANVSKAGRIDAKSMGAFAYAVKHRMFPKLTGIILDNNKIGPSSFAALVQAFQGKKGDNLAPPLEVFTVTRNSVGVVGMQALGDVLSAGAMKSLTSLCLSNNAIGNEGVTAFIYAVNDGALTNLQHLDIASNGIGDEGLVGLANLFMENKLNKLKMLGLADNRIGDTGLSRFGDACHNGKLPELTVLDLSENDIDGGGIKSFVTLKKLSHLNFFRNRINTVAAKAFADACSNSTSLTELNFRENQIGDDTVQALASSLLKGGLPILKNLNLADNEITDNGLSHLITAFSKLTTLQHLSIDTNSITNMQEFTDALQNGHLPELRELLVDRAPDELLIYAETHDIYVEAAEE